MFSKDFLNTNPNYIANEINKNGYYFHEEALDEKFISSISKDILENRLSFNNNKPGGVQLRTQYYNTFMLCISKPFFNFCTHSKILNISKLFLKTKNIRLRAHRYYETYGTHKMQWHTDAKVSKEKTYKLKSIKGLIFICYISDVSDGEFQYIKTSHLKSSNLPKYDFTEDEVKKFFGIENIKSFKGKKGSLIIYNILGVHRAKPAFNKAHQRASLFFQIDSEDNSEPLFINPSFINDINDELKYFLGFGRKSDYREFPVCSSKNLPSRLFIRKVLFPWAIEFLFQSLKNLVKFLIPEILFKYLKKRFG